VNNDEPRPYPVAALDRFKPLPNLADEASVRYVERFGVTAAPIPRKDGEGARRTVAPPKNQIVY
jgi:hypothetical protein